ncbi:hypothetical protein CVD28_02825 [Bacillus sp. M6-12]|uniref:hypothetical protein n=1 Tax=Bacillus sp. M6-12 TaxID=2054166 RepID=UPI000C75908A|nr:hypothetical protein [Bacillus sp. M6-12]PLS19366.1 hypothetical protein CVD28_02825 [Bacillus sp. M6-12]
MTHTELAILKLRKEDEMLKLQIEVLELDTQLTSKNHSKKIAGIKKLRGEKCFERVMLERELQQEHNFDEENIA